MKSEKEADRRRASSSLTHENRADVRSNRSDALRDTRGRSAVFAGRRDGDTARDPDRPARRLAFWLAILLALASAAVADSKWNGLFDFFVVWGIVAAVTAQRFIGRRATWGNPFGFPLDVVVVGICFVSATVYAISYIPYFALGHNLSDLIALQQQMFGYHDNCCERRIHTARRGGSGRSCSARSRIITTTSGRADP